MLHGARFSLLMRIDVQVLNRVDRTRIGIDMSTHQNLNTDAAPRPADVLIVGGGSVGVFAALAAKEPDISVVLIEPNNVLGGQGTGGGVAGFCGDNKRVNRPFTALIDVLEQYGLIAPYNPNADRREYDLESYAFFVQEQVASKGIKVLLHSRVLAAHSSDGAITTVPVSCASKVIEFQPKMVIDATGDCVVAVAAGFEAIHAGVYKQLPMSLYFTLWDSGQEVKSFLPPNCHTWVGDDDIPMTTLHQFPSGKVEVKMKVIGYDAADGESLSEAEIHARRQMMGLIYHLQTKGYRGSKLDRHVLASVSRHIGAREGRRIVGEYLLTEEDVTHSAVFDDAVAVGTYHLDYHWSDRVQRAGTGITTMVEPYHIPLRSLIPKGARNLLVAGRSASGDQMAMSSFRVMATCAQMGFAAGKTALQCVKENCTLPEVSVPVVQVAIENGGQSLNLSDYGEYLRQNIHVHEHIFEDSRPFAQCHASSLVQLPNNRILAVWFGGSREGIGDVAIWGAERYQGRWSVPRKLAKVIDDAHWNPVLFATPNGHVHLFFKVGKSPAVWETWSMTSEDAGVTWTEPCELVAGDRGGRGPVKNKPIILSDGTWLAGASLEIGGVWDVFVDSREDGDHTWKATTRIPLNRSDFPGAGVIQPTLWESTPGHIHMLMRSTCGYICRSDSQDYGRTWSKIRKTDLPNNNSGLDLARLYDGTLALVCTPVSERIRTPLSVLLSADNGQTWPQRLDIEADSGEFSYPAIIPTQVGMAITYTWKRERIAFWLGSVERIHRGIL